MLHCFRFAILALIALFHATGVNAAVELVDNTDIAWTFQPAGQQEKHKLNYLGLAIIHQIPKSASCCTGTYEGTFIGKSLGKLILETNLQFPALHFPAVIGLKTISINNQVIFRRVNGDYGSSGPIVSLTKELLKEQETTISVEIDHQKAFYAGFWTNRLILGEYEDLQSRRDGTLIHQKYVPLFLSYFFLFIGILLIWLTLFKKDPDRKLYIFLEATLLWAIFYYALSGELRLIFPYWGGYIHFILRSLSALSSARLLLALSDRKNSEINFVTLAGIFSILSGAILSWNGDQKWQQVGFIFVTIEFSIILFLIISQRTKKISEEPIFKFIFASGILLIIGSSLDIIKLFAIFFFSHRFSWPYVGRYTDPPFILAAMVYITQRASLQAFAEKRRFFLEKVSDQLLHDLRSPATAIRNVVLSSKNPVQQNEENEILTTASERIISMCRSLKLEDISVKKLCATDIKKALRDILSEKSFEWKNPSALELFCESNEFNARVDEHDFKRVVSNILNNSYEANQINPKIKISLSRENNFHCIKIEDNCGGISKSVLKKIRAGETESTKTDGRGIGLLNAQEYVQRWNGRFTIRTDHVKGTTVEIRVPSIMG